MYDTFVTEKVTHKVVGKYKIFEYGSWRTDIPTGGMTE